MPKRPKFQHGIKRGKICDWPADAETSEEIAKQVRYTGSSLHKSYPSPAGPPALKADEAKCDLFQPKDWPRLQEVLRDAIRAKCVGQFRGKFPSRAWAWINGVLHEARLTQAGQGDYHGLPLDDSRQHPEPVERLKDAPRVTIP